MQLSPRRIELYIYTSPLAKSPFLSGDVENLGWKFEFSGRGRELFFFFCCRLVGGVEKWHTEEAHDAPLRSETFRRGGVYRIEREGDFSKFFFDIRLHLLLRKNVGLLLVLVYTVPSVECD